MLGRAGRRGPAIQLFLVGESFLDLYWADHPDEFLDRQKNLEEMIINPDNPVVLEDHLLKANFDFPLDAQRDRQFFDSFDVKGTGAADVLPFDVALARLQDGDPSVPVQAEATAALARIEASPVAAARWPATWAPTLQRLQALRWSLLALSLAGAMWLVAGSRALRALPALQRDRRR